MKTTNMCKTKHKLEPDSPFYPTRPGNRLNQFYSSQAYIGRAEYVIKKQSERHSDHQTGYQHRKTINHTSID